MRHSITYFHIHLTIVYTFSLCLSGIIIVLGENYLGIVELIMAIAKDLI